MIANASASRPSATCSDGPFEVTERAQLLPLGPVETHTFPGVIEPPVEFRTQAKRVGLLGS